MLKAPKPPKIINQSFIDHLAKRYLERYSAPAVRLAQILNQKIIRGEHQGWYQPIDPEIRSQLIAATVATAIRIGLINDANYATARTATLSRRGRAAQTILQDLAHRGIDPEIAAAVIASNESTDEDRAASLARRKRLGPWRTKDRAERRSKDIAILCRAGFSFSIAKTIIDQNFEEE